MQTRITLAAATAALIHLGAPASAAPNVGDAPPSADEAQPRLGAPFFRPGSGEGDADLLPKDLGRPEASSGPDGAQGEHPASDHPAEAPQPKAPTRTETLDKLLNRLAKATDADEARGISRLVERMWMQSGSDTADLLMTRAVAAMNGERRDVAAALLDQIIALQPGWAEAWNKRATLRFLLDDDSGSMEDISHVLALEPRHFGALSGMGFILERHGDGKAALTALRRALAVYPGDADVRKAIDKLTLTVEGQEL